MSSLHHYCQSTFDSLSEKEFLNARQRSNPYETIKGAIFQNRSLSLSCDSRGFHVTFDPTPTELRWRWQTLTQWLDSCSQTPGGKTGLIFFNLFLSPHPPSSLQGPLLGPLDIQYFADICAGPGGFSEYVLWRRKWHAKGFGFTLKGLINLLSFSLSFVKSSLFLPLPDPESGSDFKLDAFSSPCETFDPHYGVGGYEGDGDITEPANQSEFRNYVMDNTDGEGVHFVMADGVSKTFL